MSVLLILGLSILGVLAIACVVPQKEISLTAGSMQAFVSFVSSYNIGFLVPVMAFLIVIGALASLSTWIVGPSRGLLAAAQDGDLPPYFRQLNKHGMPQRLLIVQALIVTVLSLMILFMPTINSAYWILLVMVTQVYLIMYALMFASAIKLRYKKPEVYRAYKIPGGNAGVWIVAGSGIISSLLTLFVGFFPPSQFSTGNPVFFVIFLALGIILFCAAPSLILKFQKPSWRVRLQHEKGHE
jgi:amino acid transporter